MKIIDKGVCAPLGFTANGIYCGIRKNKDKKDLALIFSEKKAVAASVYTQNLVKGAPIYVTKENIKDGYAQAIICNSGNANTCNLDGKEVAYQVCEALGKQMSIDPKDVIVASTGVIGQKLDATPIINGISELVNGLGDKSNEANVAIMTTDTVKKEIAISFEIDGKECHMGGISKGSGMIHPNMATMLVFITSDVAISHELLQKALSEDIKDTFNMISVDGDTSTNDMVSILSNGMANNKEITSENNDYQTFKQALNFVTSSLCKQIAADGEGASHLLECTVKNAKTVEDARLVAKSVITSSLFKAAMFGSDANWGRVLCAIGYSKADVDVWKINVSFESKQGEIKVCQNGCHYEFDEAIAKKILQEKEIKINIDLNDGTNKATAWGCDLTYDYVKINGDYRS